MLHFIFHNIQNSPFVVKMFFLQPNLRTVKNRTISGIMGNHAT